MTPDDLDRLDALAAAARLADPTWYDPDRRRGYHIGGIDLRLIAALDPATVRELIAAARLGAAWEAALRAARLELMQDVDPDAIIVGIDAALA